MSIKSRIENLLPILTGGALAAADSVSKEVNAGKHSKQVAQPKKRNMTKKGRARKRKRKQQKASRRRNRK